MPSDRAKGFAYGLGGAAAAGVGFGALLRFEAWRARQVIGEPTALPPRTDGRYGTAQGAPVRLLVAGDSLAAGFGVRREETVAAGLATELSRRAGRPVDVLNVAKLGARSSDLAGQLDSGLAAVPAPDVTVLIVGANDVTHQRWLGDYPQLLAGAVQRLRDAGSAVAVGTCPDVGTVEPIWQPLRGLAAKVSASYADRQERAAVDAGAHVAALGELAPAFAADPEGMFGPDRYHPSAKGYAAAVRTLLPAVLAAAAAKGIVPQPELAPEMAQSRAPARSTDLVRGTSRLGAGRDPVRRATARGHAERDR